MVLTISIWITKKKTEEKLEQIPYIWDFVTFKDQTKALLNVKNKDKVINQAFTF